MMRVCIVGNGPSAEGKGAEIDACDFVVRLRDWQRCAAEHAGSKISAHAYYGPWSEWEHTPAQCEHWWTQCPEQIMRQGEAGQVKWDFFAEYASGHLVRWLMNSQWRELQKHLGADPSTGFVSIAMALWVYPETEELVLYGFDSTTPDRPHFFDAREEGKMGCAYVVHHSIVEEKQAIARIRDGVWLGKPIATTLTWPDMPEIPE